MSTGNGQLKGFVLHTVLQGLRTHLTAAQVTQVQQSFEAACGAGSWARLESIRRLGYVSTDDYVALVKATWDALGEPAYVDYWRKQGSAFFGEGTFAAVVKGFQSAFGFTPATFLRALGVMWGMGAKDAGHFTFKPGASEGQATLVFTAPAPLLQPFFLLGLCEGLAASFEGANAEGSLRPAREIPGGVELEARWAPKRDGQRAAS